MKSIKMGGTKRVTQGESFYSQLVLRGLKIFFLFFTATALRVPV